MDPDLMGSAGRGKDLKERAAIEFLDLLPTGDCGPPSFGPSGHPFSLARVPSDGRIDQALLLAEPSIDNGQVDLFHGPIFKLSGQVMKGSIVLGDDHHTRGVFIQSMHNPRPQDSINPGEVFAMIEESIDQCA